MSHPAYKPPLHFVLRLRLQKGGRIFGTLRYNNHEFCIVCTCVSGASLIGGGRYCLAVKIFFAEVSSRWGEGGLHNLEVEEVSE